MIKALANCIEKTEEKRMLIAGISALIAIVAAIVSIIIILDNKHKKDEEYVEEDCFAE